MSRSAYEIRVLGEVPEGLLLDFEGVSVLPDPVRTMLHADLADESELHGILDALGRAGLVLLDIRREQTFEDGTEQASDRTPE